VRRFVSAFSCLLAVLTVLLVPAVARAHDEAHEAAAAAGAPHADHVDTPQELSDVNVAQEVNQARLETAGDAPLQASAALPSSWCGTERTTDDTVNAATTPTLPHFKVLYLHPSDRPDRFAQWKDLLQADASLIGQFVSGQAESSRAPRFDLGTSCGAGYLDIQTIHLPGTRATYLDNLAAIRTAVHNAVGTPAGPRNYVVLADTLNGSASGSYGLGDYYAGSASAERPDAGNPHNNGNLFAVLFYRDVAAPATSANGWWPTGMLHEMTHTMGAVQWSAPHTTQPSGGTSGVYGHCWDGLDIMCYADGPAMGHAYDTTVCAGLSGAMNQTYDCNQDDYFNPSPAAGSYLATHWDVYNNVFLADCGTLPSGSCLTGAAATGPPVNTVAPVIGGATRGGSTLTAAVGTWSPAGTTYAFQWQRDSGSGHADIAGATASTYTLVTADVGSSVRVAVTATNPDGSTVAYSGAGATVTAPPVVSPPIPAPAGTLMDTNVLTADHGTWTPSTATFTYQWLRCPAGATSTATGCVTVGLGPSYVLTGPDVGHAMGVRVTAYSGISAASAVSTLTADVQGRALVNVRAPAISGNVTVTETIRAAPGLWNVPTLTVRYQWQRCDVDGTNCVDIAGATGVSYALVAADGAHAVAVREDVTSPGSSGSVAGTPIAVADQPLPVAGVAPSIIGVPARTNNLQSRPGTWANKPTRLTYAWQRCDAGGSNCAAIPRATATNHVLGTADVGHAITVAVSALNTAGTTTVASAPTAAVAPMLPELRVAPAITGTTQVPGVVQAVRMAWKATSDTRYAFRWQRCNGAGVSCTDVPGATTQSYKLKTADARSTLRVIHTATNADGAVAATSAPTVAIKPALPGISKYPRLSVSGRPDVGKVATLTPGVWSAATEIDTKDLQFWRCNPRCAVIPSGGAATYTIDPLDTGTMLRGSEIATGPGGSLTVWAPTWIGPVRAATGGYRTLAAGASSTVRTAGGVALARVDVGKVTATAAARVAAAKQPGSLRITLRRAASARGKLRAWACVSPPKVDDRQPCTNAVALGTRSTLKLSVARGQRVLVMVVRRRT